MDTDIATLFQSCDDGAVDCTNLVDIVRQAGEEHVINGTWSSTLHVLAPSSALSGPIVFPDVSHYARSLYHGVIQPQSTSQHFNVSGFRPVIIFWSQYGNPSNAADSPYTPNHVLLVSVWQPKQCSRFTIYTPNHVVPLVTSEEGGQNQCQ